MGRRRLRPLRPWLRGATLAVVLLSGCGNSRTPVPQVGAPASPGGFNSLKLPEAGASLSVPRSWVLVKSHTPVLVLLDTSGGAVIALWRYPLNGPAPRGNQQLKQDLRGLIASARSRDPSLKVLSSSIVEASGRPALTLNTDEHIGHRERRVMSTHVFGPGEELVLEEYAPPQYFFAVDRTVFLPVLHSLTLASR